MVLEVASSALEKLETAGPRIGLGLLCGLATAVHTHVSTVARVLQISVETIQDLGSLDSNLFKEGLESISCVLPYGVRVLGTVILSGGNAEAARAVAKDVARVSVPVLREKWHSMKYPDADAYVGIWSSQLDMLNAGTLLGEEYVTSNASYVANVANCKVDLKIPIYAENGASASEGWKPGVDAALSDMEKEWTSTIFHACKPSSTGEMRFILQPNCVGEAKELSSGKQGWIKIAAGTVKSPSGESQNAGKLKYQATKVNQNWEVIWIDVAIDFLTCIDQNTPLGEFNTILQAALVNAVRCAKPQLLEHPQARKFGCFHVSIPHVFHPLSIMYPMEVADEDLIEFRRTYHQMFMLDENRPLFRPSCALINYQSSSKQQRGQRLQDVHKFVKPPGIEGGISAVVDGSYDYCHYMQDKFNDDGWGCAYRSLQTVFSWFLRQHYTDKQIPSHRQIQETLVDIGDKDVSFINSREWIGSIEVGFVLDELLEVENQVVMKRADQDPRAVAKQLLHHFQTDGTPVSIGGGVLAYTLLGVHYNEATGDVAFLILDPHYTGEDDIDKICRGGWIAWKKPTDKAAAGGPLFAPNTFYNFMCPKRPNVI